MSYKTLLSNLVCFLSITFTASIECEILNPPNTLLVYNMENFSVLPKNFRTCQDSFLEEHTSSSPSRKGYDTLNISGSGQFSEKSLQALLQKLHNGSLPIYIFDLRQESHAYVNGNAVGWYAPRGWSNQDKSMEEITKEEEIFVKNIADEKQIIINKIIKKDDEGINLPQAEPILVNVESSCTEKQMLSKYNVNYIRIPCQDHVRPTDSTVDKFILIIKNLPQDHWMHFHCSAGMGRSTTFMVMYDMMMNAKEVSFEDIMDRNWKIGGTNLLKKYPETNWKRPFMMERIEFLKVFYEYCKQNQDHFQQPWSMFKP